MADVFPETACGDYGQIVIDDHKTSYSPIVSGKSSAVGYGEVVGVQVHKGKAGKAGCSSNASCFSAGSAFGFGGTTVLDPYTSSAHYGLDGNVGLPGFATLPYTAGAWAGGYSRTPIVLNSASNAGLSCGTNSHCGSKPKAFTTRKVVKQIGGFNASSVVSYCKNPYTGCIETSGIQVHRDSGINDVAKLAASAGAIAAGTGSVLSGVGAIKYGNARENIAENGLTQRFEGMGDTNINVEGSSAHASGGEANAGASASAKAYQKTHNDIDIGISNSNHNGGGKGHGGPKGGGMPMTPKD